MKHDIKAQKKSPTAYAVGDEFRFNYYSSAKYLMVRTIWLV